MLSETTSSSPDPGLTPAEQLRQALLAKYAPEKLEKLQADGLKILDIALERRKNLPNASHHDLRGMHQNFQGLFEQITDNIRKLQAAKGEGEISELCRRFDPITFLSQRRVEYDRLYRRDSAQLKEEICQHPKLYMSTTELEEVADKPLSDEDKELLIKTLMKEAPTRYLEITMVWNVIITLLGIKDQVTQEYNRLTSAPRL